MHLVYLGEALVASKEHELHNHFEFGVNAIVEFNDGFGREIVVLTNLTEVHHKYLSPIRDQKIAFESDHHGTGGTESILQLKFVEVKRATMIHSEWSMSLKEFVAESEAETI
jgi:hypothetical protein